MTQEAQGTAPPPVSCVLTIGGLDPSGGAGLTADARACAAFGAHALPILTAAVAQNTRGVREYEPVTPDMLKAQLDTLLEDIRPDAIKIGLLPGIAWAEIVAERLRVLHNDMPELPIVLDPVFAPSNGPGFSSDETVAYIASRLLPICDLVTPNIPEAARLCGRPEAATLDEMAQSCIAIYENFSTRHVLIKGGHLPPTPDDEETAGRSADVLFDGTRFLELRARRITDYETRGTGCLLASAIAAQLARGIAMSEAARAAKIWLTRAIQNAQPIGSGRRVAV